MQEVIASLEGDGEIKIELYTERIYNSFSYKFSILLRALCSVSGTRIKFIMLRNIVNSNVNFENNTINNKKILRNIVF